MCEAQTSDGLDNARANVSEDGIQVDRSGDLEDLAGFELNGMEQETESLPNDPHVRTYETYYLRRATAELAGDLDKVRSADDFTDKSVAILIDAVRQGVTAIPLGERRKVATMGKR
ncbi:MAG: hypothetical protein M1840_007684 [Geoglossum simile]|nr:MAG: hypothetical protein M1840_007684 [Geoglossum simile]